MYKRVRLSLHPLGAQNLLGEIDVNKQLLHAMIYEWHKSEVVQRKEGRMLSGRESLEMLYGKGDACGELRGGKRKFSRQTQGLACRRGKRGGHDRQKEQHRQRKQRQETALCLGAVLLLTCGE